MKYVLNLNMNKPRCWELPGHYLRTPGCVISIEKGVKPVNAMSPEMRLVRKQRFLLYISHRQGLMDWKLNSPVVNLIQDFCAFGLKGWLGASSNQIVHLYVCLSVCLSISL